MSAVLFFIAAIGAITGAIGVVMLRNQFYSVLALVFHLVSLAALFLLLRAEFGAAAQVIVYAGAVMVLYVFVVAYVGGGEEVAGGRSGLSIFGPLLAIALAVELCVAVLGTALKGIGGKGAPYVPGFGTPEQIAELDRRMEVYSKDPTQVTTWEAIRGGFPDPRMSDLEISEAPKARLIPAWGNAPGKPQTKPER